MRFDNIRYAAADSLYVIVVYYNPCGYRSRRETYDNFMTTLNNSGIKTITVECAFKDDRFELPERPDVIKVRSNTLLWQKERLINIGACYLPETCRHVAWIDCDIIFENRNWAVDTCRMLDNDCTIVQLFETCSRLEQGNLPADPPDLAHSFAAVAGRDQSTLDCGRYDRHGHTGYGWAMRREIFDQLGLYEHAVSGSADHFMAHAIYNSYGFCVENALKHDRKQIQHFEAWGNKFYRMAQGKLGAVPGRILHLWHGSHDRRDYFHRMWKITDYGFNPDTDLLAMPGRPLEWQPDVLINKPRLVAYFAEYFASRQEDTV